MSLSPANRRRLLRLAALAAVVVLGLASRAFPLGWSAYDKSLGDVLYAVAAYLAFAILLPRSPPWLLAALAFASCLAVEGLQLTELNRRLLAVPVLRWFLGTTFSWHDIACYALGTLVTAALDRRLPPADR